MTALLEVRGLRKEYSLRSPLLRRRTATVTAVDGVDLTIAAGEIVAVVGESGSGKTTLGRAILRLVEPTAGSVRFRGEDLLALDAESMRQRRRHLQTVFQDPFASLNPRLRVREALLEPLRAYGPVRERDGDETVERLLAEVGLPAETAGRFPHQLSGGQRQRIGVARALATSPELLIADEPVSALDVSVRAQVVNLLLELRERRGLAILLVAHDLTLVGHIADRVIVLYLGRVVEEGPASDVLNAPRHPYTAALLAAVLPPEPGARAERGAPRGEPPSPLRVVPGCGFHPRCPLAEARCRELRPALEPRSRGGRVACHLAARCDPEIAQNGVEPFAAADVKRTDAAHGATQ